MIDLRKAIFLSAVVALFTSSSAQFLIHNFRSMTTLFSGLDGWVNDIYSPGYAYDFPTDSDPIIGTTYSQEFGPEFGRSIQVICGTVPDTITGVQFCGAAFVMPFTASTSVATDISQYSTLEMLYASNNPISLEITQFGQGGASFSCMADATPGGAYQRLVCDIQKENVDAGAPGALSLPDWACADLNDTVNCIEYRPDSSQSLILAFTTALFGDTINADIMALCFDDHPTCHDSTVPEGQIMKSLTDSADYKWGCTDSLAPNYNPNAIYELGNCLPIAVERIGYNHSLGFHHKLEEKVLEFSGIEEPVPIEIYNTAGQLVLRGSLSYFSNQISVADYKPGVYILHINKSFMKFTIM